MIIKIENLTKIYGKQKAVDSVSFELKQGELVGFLGPNGAGKSTTMKIITGFLAATSGNVWINNELMTPNNYKLRNYIGYLPEHNPLYANLYIKEYLSLTAGMYGLKDIKKQLTKVVEMVGLESEQNKKIAMLSKGYRQRVGLAQALIHDPQLLILDEPTTGLDPNQLEEIRKLIKEISKEKTVIFSTHIMQEVEAICNRVLIINNGKLIADKPANELKDGKFSAQQKVFVEFARAVDINLLKANLNIETVEPNGKFGFYISSSSKQDIRPAIFNFAIENECVILTLNAHQESLEDIFHQLTR